MCMECTWKHVGIPVYGISTIILLSLWSSENSEKEILTCKHFFIVRSINDFSVVSKFRKETILKLPIYCFRFYELILCAYNLILLIAFKLNCHIEYSYIFISYNCSFIVISAWLWNLLIKHQGILGNIWDRMIQIIILNILKMTFFKFPTEEILYFRQTDVNWL